MTLDVNGIDYEFAYIKVLEKLINKVFDNTSIIVNNKAKIKRLS